MKTISAIIAASVLFGSAAYAQGNCIGCTIVQPEPSVEYGTRKIENVPVKQNPFDLGDINQSPIRGKGQIHVVHNAPAPDDTEAELTKAAWLLKDNGWTVFKPNGRRQ